MVYISPQTSVLGVHFGVKSLVILPKNFEQAHTVLKYILD